MEFPRLTFFSDKSDRTNIPVLTTGTVLVGQLYNGQTDQIIEGGFLWSNMQIKEYDVSYSNAEVKFEKSLTDRIDLLDIYASLKLSFLSKMVEVSESGNFRKYTSFLIFWHYSIANWKIGKHSYQNTLFTFGGRF